MSQSDGVQQETVAPPGARVLVVDDQTQIRTLVAGICGNLGHQARCAGSAEEAAQLEAEFRPDLYIVDMILPEADGVEYIADLMTSTSNPRVIVMSGYGDGFLNLASALPAFYRNGRVWKLRKPFRRSELESTIRDALAVA